MEPTTPKSLRVIKALMIHSIVLLLSQAIPVLVGINIYTEVDLVDIKLV